MRCVKRVYAILRERIHQINNDVVFNPQKYYVSIRNKRNVVFCKIRKKKVRLVVMLPLSLIQEKIEQHPVKELSQPVQDFYNGPYGAIDVMNLHNFDEVVELIRSLLVLPNAVKARINSTKLRDYLLSSSHPIGRFKQPFFSMLGYSKEHWQQLETDLFKLAAIGETRFGKGAEYGQKYEVRGILRGPSGRTAEVVSIWIIFAGEDIPRFVTAFTAGKR